MSNIIIYKQTRYLNNELYNILKKYEFKDLEVYINFSGKSFRKNKLEKYIFEKCETNKIFMLSHLSKKYKKIYFTITFNTLNMQLSKNIHFNRFEYFNKNVFLYKEKPKLNIEGDIVIFLNNSEGYYNKYLNYEVQIPKLISIIRKYNKTNKIKIRPHPRETLEIENIVKKIKKYEKKIYLDKRDYSHFKNKIFVIFIQNSVSILDFLNLGIPLMNPNFIPQNDYEDVYINYHNLKNMIDFVDRKKLLNKYYNYILTKDEIQKNPEFIKKFLNKNIKNNL